MKYKIAIADDEPLVIVGLKSMLDWEALDMAVVGTAKNGEQLMRLIEEASPDIVITDVRMPVRSGLDVMAECAARFGRKPLFIVLTSHEEFAYVKQAIDCQAVNYLVKIELSPESLLESLRRAIAMLAESRGPESRGDYRPDTQHFADKFLVRLLNGLFESRRDFAGQMDALGISFPGDFFFAAYCGMEDIDRTKGSRDRQISLFSSSLGIVRDTMDRFLDCRIVSLDISHFAVVFCGDIRDAARLADQAKEALTHAIGLVRNYFAVTLKIASGRPVYDAWDLHESFASARKLYSRNGGPASGPLFFDRGDEADDASGFDLSAYRDDLSRSFREVDLDSLADTLGRVVTSLRESAPDHAHAMDAASGILFMAASLLPDGEEILTEIFSLERLGYRVLYEYKTAEECVAWIARLRDGLVATLGGRRRDYRETVIARVRRYIDENVDRKLTLGEVASIHGLSQNYLSTLFSRYAGCSFVEYATRAKISEAKRMLLAGESRIQDVAERLGFESAFYFSKVFKKTEGVSPREFAQRGNGHVSGTIE